MKHSSSAILEMKRKLQLSIANLISERLTIGGVEYKEGPTHEGKMYYWATCDDPYGEFAHSMAELKADIERDIMFWKDAIYMRIEAMSITEIKAHLNERDKL